MLTDSELRQIRADVAALLPQSATIQRRTLADDGVGGKLAEYTDSASVACRLAFAGSKDEPTQVDAAEAGRIVAQVKYIITLPWDADIQATDRLSIEGAAYEMLSPVVDRFNEVSKRILARKL